MIHDIMINHEQSSSSTIKDLKFSNFTHKPLKLLESWSDLSELFASIVHTENPIAKPNETPKDNTTHRHSIQMSSSDSNKNSNNNTESELLSNLSLGFIGSGQMSSAIIRGLVEQKTLQAQQIHATDIYDAPLSQLKRELNIHTHSNNNIAIVQQCHVVVLAVKPNHVETVLREIASEMRKKSVLLVSIAAGVNLSTMTRYLSEESGDSGDSGGGSDDLRLVRVMPNVNCLVGEAASAYCMSKGAIVGRDDRLTSAIFSSVGVIEQVQEYLMDAVTGLSGSGPAYVFMFIEALADGGVRAGLPRPIALKLAAQTVLGSAKSCLNGQSHPAQLKDMVCSPSGTTISGVHELERGSMRAAVMNAVLAATKRSKELGLPNASL